MAETAIRPPFAVTVSQETHGAPENHAARENHAAQEKLVAPEERLARLWFAALAAGRDEPPAAPDTFPMTAASAGAFLTVQSATLIDIMFGDPFRPRLAAGIGHALVLADFVNANVLGRSLRVLLLRLPDLITDCAPAGVQRCDLEYRVAAVTEALANGYVRALRDRTLAEQKSIMRAELDAQRIISEQLRHQATHDPLTGLPNRAGVLDRLAAALTSGRDANVGLCYLDLDGFKSINDRYGHEVGDELLVAVAGRIGEVARAGGALAGRIGGDEFVVVAEASPGVAWMVALARGILAGISSPVALSVGTVSVSACAGIVERACSSPAAATMVSDADAALYLAKSRGHGQWAVYDEAIRQASLRPRGSVTKPTHPCLRRTRARE
jgi:diguanylate cyclase (GGDEF)-like protein